jgi:hypothetical protein
MEIMTLGVEVMVSNALYVHHLPFQVILVGLFSDMAKRWEIMNYIKDT